jgi:hypothetical protein
MQTGNHRSKPFIPVTKKTECSLNELSLVVPNFLITLILNILIQSTWNY